MKKKYLLFDLDGTLTDPMEGITRSVQYALEHYGIREPDQGKLGAFSGAPLKQSFMKYYGFEEKKAAEAVWVYREYYSSRGIFENRVYEGIPEMLRELQSEGRKLLVATSKPEVYARQILEHFDLDRYFSFIGGADMEESRVEKGDVIRYVLEKNSIAETSLAVMAGDREHDILGARKNGMDSVGVLFGYGSRRELEEAGARVLAETVKDLGHLLAGEWEDGYVKG